MSYGSKKTQARSQVDLYNSSANHREPEVSGDSAQNVRPLKQKKAGFQAQPFFLRLSVSLTTYFLRLKRPKPRRPLPMRIIVEGSGI